MGRRAFDIQQIFSQSDLYADLGIGCPQVFKFQRLLKIGDDGIQINNASAWTPLLARVRRSWTMAAARTPPFIIFST